MRHIIIMSGDNSFARLVVCVGGVGGVGWVGGVRAGVGSCQSPHGKPSLQTVHR